MVDEPQNTSQNDEPQETNDDEMQHDNLSADIIKEEDFETVGPHDDNDEEVELLPDEETELLPTLPNDSDLAADWGKIQESDDGYLPDKQPEPVDEEDEPTNHAPNEAPAVALDKVSVIVEDDLEGSDEASDAADEPDEEAEVEEEPYIPEPPKPAWKAHMEQMRAEKEAKHRKMIEDRRAYEAARRAEREAHRKQIREDKRKADAQIKAQFEESREERQSAVEDTMQRIREERERKQREMEAAREQLKREREEKSYLNHRNSDNDASNNQTSDTSNTMKTDKPKTGTRDLDIDARANRLSKPEED